VAVPDSSLRWVRVRGSEPNAVAVAAVEAEGPLAARPPDQPAEPEEFLGEAVGEEGPATLPRGWVRI